MEIKLKISDMRATPKWLMDLFSDYFDPCPYEYPPKTNGLLLDWKDKNYVNPPYSNVMPWVDKAIEESTKGKIVVLLLKFDATTEWHRKLMQNNAHLSFLGERLKFVNVFEKTNTTSPFTSALYILNNKQWEE